MGDVLENLFSVIPIVLAILWVMRRASKKKTGAKAAESPTVSERLRRFEKKVTKAVQGASTRESSGDRSSGEEELYEKIETRRVEVPRQPVQPVNTVERLVEDRSKEDEGKKYSGPEKSNSFERIRELSPLAQGIVWSFILDEPPALKEPKN